MVGGKDYKTQKTHRDMKDVPDTQAATDYSTIKGQSTRIRVPRAEDQHATPNGTEGIETRVQSITNLLTYSTEQSPS